MLDSWLSIILADRVQSKLQKTHDKGFSRNINPAIKVAEIGSTDAPLPGSKK
jgi:hypothetical protein